MKKSGIDITSKRFGILEKKAIEEILKKDRDAIIYDLGSGKSFFSFAVAFCGYKIFAIDKQDFFWRFFWLKKFFGLKNISFQKKDLAKAKKKDFSKNISVVYCARFFHYLSYQEGENLLEILSKNLAKDGKIFFSITGIESFIGKDYEGKNFPPEKRFGKIAKENQKRFEIEKKVCLYSKKEAEFLFSRFFKIEEIWENDFKNIFIIASKK